MYCSITTAKTKKPRWFKKESLALRNPKIIRGELFKWKTMDKDGSEMTHQRIKDSYITGEKIVRVEIKPSYIIKIGESYRQDGKVKTRQKHIKTFHEWEVIDTFLDYQKSGNKQGTGYFIDGYDFDKDVQKAFPDATASAWALVQDKIEPIENSIIKAFKQTEEYYWWLKTQALMDDLEVEKNKTKAKEEEKQQQEHKRNAFTANSNIKVLSLSSDEIRIIDTCYKAMAVQLHPDRGGSGEDMAILNNLKDRIRKVE